MWTSCTSTTFDSPPGLKRQVTGVSFESLSSAFSSSCSPHPWHDRIHSWLGTGLLEAAIVQSECVPDAVESLKIFCDIGKTGVTGASNYQRFTSRLENLVRRVSEGLNSSPDPEAQITLADVWRQSKVGSLSLPISTLVLILEHCEDLLLKELEQSIVDNLSQEEGLNHQPSLILQTISRSANLFVKFMKTFASLLQETGNQSKLMILFQTYSDYILTSSTNPITLYPSKYQGLAALFIIYTDLSSNGKKLHSSPREDLVKRIRCTDLSDLDSWLICAQFDLLNMFD